MAKKQRGIKKVLLKRSANAQVPVKGRVKKQKSAELPKVQGGGKMTDIEKTKDVVSEFLEKTLNVKDVKVVKIAKLSDGWETEAEVYEESSFIKSLGLSTRVQDRNIYAVKLDDNLEVQSYEKKGRE